MADADNKDTSQKPDGNGAGGGTGKEDALAQQLAKIQEDLGKMNAQMEATQAAIAAANQRANPSPKPEEEDLYDPQQLLRRAEAVFDTRLRADKDKDMTIYRLSQDYPEIQTDSKLRQAVLEEQRLMAESFRDTADGYRLAVLQATAKAGLVPKSQRKTVEDDVSYDGRRVQRTPPKRIKVSDATIMAAQLMGRDTDDPEVMKRLEDAANRDTYTKYR